MDPEFIKEIAIKRQLGRHECLLLKAKIVSCMTPEVKKKIEEAGFTPTEIATVYIFRIFSHQDDDYSIVDIHSLNIIQEHIVPNYEILIFSETGKEIIDILF